MQQARMRKMTKKQKREWVAKVNATRQQTTRHAPACSRRRDRTSLRGCALRSRGVGRKKDWTSTTLQESSITQLTRKPRVVHSEQAAPSPKTSISRNTGKQY